MDVTHLNGHVLLEILSLAEIFDSIRFIKSCKRMQDLEETFSKKFTTFDYTKIKKHLSLVELNELLHFIGKSLTILNLSNIKTKL